MGSEKGKSEEEEEEEERRNSPLATPHCKYTSKTHPKLWRDAAPPAPASVMNVTNREGKMITLQRRQGGHNRRGGGEERKNHFDGLCPSWDNLVMFLDRNLTRLHPPPSPRRFPLPPPPPSPFVISNGRHCDNDAGADT